MLLKRKESIDAKWWEEKEERGVLSAIGIFVALLCTLYLVFIHGIVIQKLSCSLSTHPAQYYIRVVVVAFLHFSFALFHIYVVFGLPCVFLPYTITLYYAAERFCMSRVNQPVDLESFFPPVLRFYLIRIMLVLHDVSRPRRVCHCQKRVP